MTLVAAMVMAAAAAALGRVAHVARRNASGVVRTGVTAVTAETKLSAVVAVQVGMASAAVETMGREALAGLRRPARLQLARRTSLMRTEGWLR